MNKKALVFAAALSGIFSIKTYAGINDSGSKFNLSGYIDAYYGYYTDSAGHGNFQEFPTISPRSNQVGLNIAQLTADYSADKIRGIVTLQYGDIPACIWAPGSFNYIQEAHAGVRIAKKLWLDAGFFKSHVGTEDLLPKDNIATTLTVGSYYEPYYECGIRLNFLATKKLAINLYLVNGYKIFEENNNKKSFGALVTYALGDNGSIGYSNYIGDDTPDEADSVSHLRTLQVLFFNYQFGKLKMQLGADYGTQGNARIYDTRQAANMFCGLASLKYKLTDKWLVYGRGEWFSDPDGLMSGVMTDSKGKQTGLKIWGITGGLELKPTKESYLRVEARRLQAEQSQKIFRWDGKNENGRVEVSVNLGVIIQ